MDLPVTYPVNAIDYNAAAINTKKRKERMEYAQRRAKLELEDRLAKPEKLAPEEEEKFIQSIMHAIIEDGERMRDSAMKRRNAFETLPALEEFRQEFGTPRQVCE